MIAQDIQKIYPELVYEDGGHLSLAYDKLSVIALEAIDVLNEKNKELELSINTVAKLISGLRRSTLNSKQESNTPEATSKL
jgi:hypothetical protein